MTGTATAAAGIEAAVDADEGSTVAKVTAEASGEVDEGAIT